MEQETWRYMVVEVPRCDGKGRDDVLWEQGRAGWELVQVLEGSTKDPADRTSLTLFFKRSATADIGV
jgi:hypothetical protein